jgi:F-type H+-transporting ATPase subunit b
MPVLGLLESSIQLVPDGTLLLHVALIALMVTILNLTLFRPINRILEERDRLTRGRLGEAEATAASVAKKMTEYEKHLRDSRAEGYRLMEQRRIEALREREQKIGAIKLEISNWVEGEKAELSRQASEAREVLALEARKLSLEIGSQILGRSVSNPVGNDSGRRL